MTVAGDRIRVSEKGCSAYSSSTSPVWGATGSTYEQFNFANPFDLELSTTDYNP